MTMLAMLDGCNFVELVPSSDFFDIELYSLGLVPVALRLTKEEESSALPQNVAHTTT